MAPTQTRATGWTPSSPSHPPWPPACCTFMSLLLSIKINTLDSLQAKNTSPEGNTEPLGCGRKGKEEGPANLFQRRGVEPAGGCHLFDLWTKAIQVREIQQLVQGCYILRRGSVLLRPPGNGRLDYYRQPSIWSRKTKFSGTQTIL